MQRYIYRRLLLAIPTIFGVTLLIFLAMRVLPGDPLAVIYGDTGVHILTDEQVAAARHSLGLDRPLHIQYLSWMADVFKGDMGSSFWTDTPISKTILRRGPITGQVALMAVVISWVVGLPVGVIGATRRNSFIDYLSRVFVTFFMSVPVFWLGMTFILFTVLVFTWRPPVDIAFLWDDPVRNLQMTLPPSVAMGVGLAAYIARMSRATLLEVFREDYIRTARAKGLAERTVVWRHVMGNALLPVVTVSGLTLAVLLGGSVAVEKAFGFPGLGLSLVYGITQRDWMLIQNLVLVYAVIFVLANLVIDLTYAWIDPRIRYE